MSCSRPEDGPFGSSCAVARSQWACDNGVGSVKGSLTPEWSIPSPRRETGGLVPPIFSAPLAAPATTHHTPPEPYQRPKYCRHNCIGPQRPNKAPEQEAYLDMHPVLDGEDDQYRQSDERDNHPSGGSLTCL